MQDASAFSLAPRFKTKMVSSPCRSALQTADALGQSALLEPALAEIDHGRWTGLSFEEIAAAEPGALSSWINNPVNGAPGGETMDQAQQRIGQWLDGIADDALSLCAISHPMIIRAAMAHALGFPLGATLAIDIAPLSEIRLSYNRSWRLQLLASSITRPRSATGTA